MKPKTLKIAGGVVAAVVLALVFVFRQGIEDDWHAYKKNREAMDLIQQGRWSAAMQAAHEAVRLNPNAAAYQLNYVEARRSFMKDLKIRLAALDPITYLLAIHDVSDQLGTVLDDDAETQIDSWTTEHESPALDEAAAAFDADMDTLGKIFKGHEEVFTELFSAENQPKAHVMLVAWKNLNAAETAWNANDPDQVAAFIGKVPTNYCKAVCAVFQDRLGGVRKQIQVRWDAASKLVVENDFLGAKAIFTELQGHESWISGLQQARTGAQSAGEGFYTQKMVEANAAKQYQDAGNWLKNLLVLQGQKTDGINFSEIFKGGTTAGFLQTLGELGLHPIQPQDRKGFTDVLLVAADIDNLTDPDVAQKFLGDTYLDWASREFQNNHFGTACYLALLAQKHGNSSAAAVFDNFHAEVMNHFSVAVSALPEENPPANADKDFCDDLYSETLNAVHANLPPWIKYEDAENPLSNFTPMFRLKLKACLTKFASEYQRSSRPVSREFPIQVTVDNPAIPDAQQQVVQAQADLEKAQRDYQQAKQTAAAAGQATSMVANQLFGGLGGMLAGAVAGGAVANSTSTAAVDQAAQALSSAQNALANLPKQVEQTQNKLFHWTETDHATVFHASFQIGLGVTENPLWSQSLDASIKHSSTERRGIDEVNLAPMEREEPDVQKIESILSSSLKPQIDAVAGANLLQPIKITLGKYVAGEGAATDIATQQDRQLGTELLWWDTPLRDYQALSNPVFLGRFGDVVTAPAASAATQ